MADVKKAVDYVIDNFEDVGRTGKVTTDRGGRTRFGVAEKFHPELTDTTFYTDMPKDEALAMAEGIYDKDYLEPMKLADLDSQELANYVLDIGINMGVTQAAREVHQALHALALVPDGLPNIFGPITHAAMKTADVAKFLPMLRAFRKAYYDAGAADGKYSHAEYTSYMRRTAAMGR